MSDNPIIQQTITKIDISTVKTVDNNFSISVDNNNNSNSRLSELSRSSGSSVDSSSSGVSLSSVRIDEDG